MSRMPKHSKPLSALAGPSAPGCKYFDGVLQPGGRQGNTRWRDGSRRMAPALAEKRDGRALPSLLQGHLG